MKTIRLMTLLTSLTATAFAQPDPFGNHLAASLFQQWAGGSETTFFSPYSIAAALTMTSQGARGETASQIAAALGYDSTSSAATAAQQLESRLTQLQANSSNLTITAANGLFPQHGYQLNREFVTNVSYSFYAGVQAVDYITATEQARTTINSWVAERTADKISELLAAGVLTPATRLTLVNAIYFKGNWLTPFDPKLTHDAPFHTAAGDRVTVAMMHCSTELRHAALKGVSGVELPYEGGGLTMLLLLPDAGAAPDTIANFVATNGVAAWERAATTREVHLFLPRFTARWSQECSDVLRHLGITTLFNPAAADLSGIAGRPGDLAVSAVIHQAFVEVNETGTEAAAATAITIRMTALRPDREPVTFRIDRPFAFLIRERRSGAILFAGSIQQLEASACRTAQAPLE